jgi:hypothetical protein
MVPSTTRTTTTTPTKANSRVVAVCEGVTALLVVVVDEENRVESAVAVLLDDVVVVVMGASKTYVATSVELADNFRDIVGDVTPSPHLEKPRVVPLASFTVCGSAKL